MKKLYAGRLILQPSAVLRLRIFDRYAIHRIMQDLFHSDLVLGHVAATGDAPSGIQWADKGEHLAGRVIDFLANRRPECSVPEDVDLQCRELPEDFLLHDRYRFQVELNPVRCVNRKRRVPGIRDPLRDGSGVVRKSFRIRIRKGKGLRFRFLPGCNHLIKGVKS